MWKQTFHANTFSSSIICEYVAGLQKVQCNNDKGRPVKNSWEGESEIWELGKPPLFSLPGSFRHAKVFSQNFPPPLIFPQSTWCPFKCFTFYCKYQTGESHADYLHIELTPCLTWYTCILFFSSSKFDCLVWSAQTCTLFLQILVFLDCLVDCLLYMSVYLPVRRKAIQGGLARRLLPYFPPFSSPTFPRFSISGTPNDLLLPHFFSLSIHRAEKSFCIFLEL